MLKHARKEGNFTLRNFEAMDYIHERMRNRVDEGLTKLEPLIKKQLHSLYFEKKPNLYTLAEEKRRLDKLDLEKLDKKTKVPVNLLTLQEKEIKNILLEYDIDPKKMKLPYSSKIK